MDEAFVRILPKGAQNKVKKFESVNDLTINKLYTVLLKDGQKKIVFRDQKGIRTNAHELDKTKNAFEPLRYFDVDEIVEYEELTSTTLNK